MVLGSGVGTDIAKAAPATGHAVVATGPQLRVVFNEPEFPIRTFERVIYALGGTTANKFSADIGNRF